MNANIGRSVWTRCSCCDGGTNDKLDDIADLIQYGPVVIFPLDPFPQGLVVETLCLCLLSCSA